MPTTSTGIAGVSINAACSVPKAGEFVTGAGLLTACDSLTADLATIRDTALCPVNGFAMSGACTVGTTLDVAGLLSATAGIAVTGGYLSLGAGLSASVTAATAANPIVITTSPALPLNVGDQVTVAGVGGNTAANGTWAIAAISGTSITLKGSTGVSAYTSGGTVTWSSQLALGGTRSATRVLSSTFRDIDTNWILTIQNFAGDGRWVDANPNITTAPCLFGWMITADDAPHGSILTAATVDMQPATGHVGTTLTLPTLRLMKRSVNWGALGGGSAGVGGASAGLNIGLGTYPTPANFTAYELETNFGPTGLSDVVDRSRYVYMVVLSTEHGAQGVVGASVFGCSVTTTTFAPIQR